MSHAPSCDISLQDREEIYSLVLKIQYNFTFIQTFDFIFLLLFSKITGIGTCIKIKCFYIMPQLCKIILINFLSLDLLLMFKISNCIKHLIFPHHFGFLIILDIFFLAGLFFWIDSPCLDYFTALSSLGLVRNRTFHLRSTGMYIIFFPYHQVNCRGNRKLELKSLHQVIRLQGAVS